MLWKINDDWNALLTQSYQNMDAQGVFYQMPYGSEGTKFNSLGEPYGGRSAAALFGDPVQSLLRQGQVREHLARRSTARSAP